VDSEVGDDTHLAFFEILGNWSLGDYYREEAIRWSFEFLVQELGLPVDRLGVTCFAGDDDVPRDDESANFGLSTSSSWPSSRRAESEDVIPRTHGECSRVSSVRLESAMGCRAERVGV